MGVGGGNAAFGINSEFSVSPYGGTSSSMGVNVGIPLGQLKALGLSANASFDVGSGGANGGLHLSAGNLIGASLHSSGGVSYSLARAAGGAGVYNGSSGHVSTRSSNFQADIPVGYSGLSVRIARSWQRYWIDESKNAYTFGALYGASVTPSIYAAFDTYDLPDADLDLADFDDPEKVLGGSFPDVDLYTVAAQGISGNMEPYQFRKQLFRQDKENEDQSLAMKSYDLRSAPQGSGANYHEAQFRFVDDFSNRYEYEAGDFSFPGSRITYDFNGNPYTGESGDDGFSASDNHLVGSKNIEWYSNREILSVVPGSNPKKEGFMDCAAEGFVRQNDDQVGGFSITNSSGVTYHFALPVYSYNEFMKSTYLPNLERYQTLTKPARYAYTWYLTAVTGPDFVDRNENGVADRGDWGYWVRIEYKKWLGDYKWRNPGSGSNKDLDAEWEFYSTGLKELYYVEKIVSDTHVALFEKSQRIDGREVINTGSGGFGPLTFTWGKQTCRTSCQEKFCHEGNCQEPDYTACYTACESLEDDATKYIFSRPTLRLDKIKLFSYDDFASGKTGDEFVLRAVAFDYSYALAMGTSNSYDENSPLTRQGKLTLNAVQFLGKKCEAAMPSFKFSYGNNPAYDQNKRDVWGFYKSDFTTQKLNETNDIIGRLTTAESANDVDAWSLTDITTPLGASIKVSYESDAYNEVALAKQNFLRIKSVTDVGQNDLKLTFWEDVDVDDYFKADDGRDIEMDIDLVVGYDVAHAGTTCACSDFETVVPREPLPKGFSGTVKVKSTDVQDKSIVVTAETLYNQLKSDPKKFRRTTHLENGDEQRRYCDMEYIECEFRFWAWHDFFIAGVASIPKHRDQVGGGLRVQSISIQSPAISGGGISGHQTTYEYENGSTTYEPFEVLEPKIDPAYAQIAEADASKKMYKRSVLKRLYKQFALARVVPGPGVIYRDVTVKGANVTADGQTHALPNKVHYQFETYHLDWVDMNKEGFATPAGTGEVEGITYKSAYLNHATLKDYSTRLGALKSITLLNDDNQPISATTYKYFHDDLSEADFKDQLRSTFSNQGVTEQTFSRSRVALFKIMDKVPYSDEAVGTRKKDEYRLLATISQRKRYPAILTEQTDQNFLTGITTTKKMLGFDFYSGEVTSEMMTDSYGTKVISETMPAYRQYPKLGSKALDSGNKNMLSQSAGTKTYIVGSNGDPSGLLSASAQTWSSGHKILNQSGTQTDIWRPLGSFSWNGENALNADGTYPLNQFVPFDWNEPALNAQWIETSHISLYDVNSHGLEVRDVNGNYGSTRMDRSQNKAIATAAPARYAEMAYSGAESYTGNTDAEGGVTRQQGSPSRAFAHTGAFGLSVATGGRGFSYTLKASETDLSKKYRASVWLYAPGETETQVELDKVDLFYTVNGKEIKAVSAVLQKSKSKNWYLLDLIIVPDGSNNITIAVRNNAKREVYFDDFRVHPLNATMTSYVYDQFSGELTYILDGNNFYTHFEYDGTGRLIRSSREQLNYDFGDGKESFKDDAVINEVKYNYGRKD